VKALVTKRITATLTLGWVCLWPVTARGGESGPQRAEAGLVQRRDLVTTSPGVFRPFVFLHAGDPQIGFVGKNQDLSEKIEADKRRFAELARRANTLAPAFVYIAGDLVHADLPETRAAFDEVLRTFEVPVKIVPGNHDRPSRDWVKAKRYGDGAYNVVLFNNCAFVALDSMDLALPMADSRAPAGSRGGKETQWEWLESTLEKVRTCRHVFVLMHFPPFVEREDEKAGYYNLPPANRARLLDLVRKHGVKTILAGHVHKNLVIGPQDGTFTIYTVGGTARSSNGYGYRAFVVREDGVEQAYLPLERPVERFELD
jgi:DNA repair exonuclease SbcCD nuclease subunit